MDTQKAHRLQLDRRQAATVTGVRDVISFDEKEILLETEYGRMTVKGEGLHVKRLTLENGEVVGVSRQYAPAIRKKLGL